MTGKCQQKSFFFNEFPAGVRFQADNVTLGPAASDIGIDPFGSVLQGKYPDVHGFSACAQSVGVPAQKCEELV